MADPQPSDEECIARTSAGDSSGFALLWKRHSRAAYAVARSYRTLDADDLVAESFAKVLRAIMNGGGPSLAFRAYLFTTIRNTAASQLAKAQPVSIERDLDYEAAPQLSVSGPEISADSAATRAFATLPQRWQQVLWYVGVEGMSPVEAAPLLGLTPNGVSALAMRARKRFRRELVIASTADLPSESACRLALLAKVGATTEAERFGLAPANPHVCEECNQCRSILGETGAIRPSLAIIVFIAALGAGSAMTFIALAASTATKAEVGGAEPVAPVTLTSVPATAVAAKVVVLTASLAVVALAVAGIAAISFEQTASPPASNDRNSSRVDPVPAPAGSVPSEPQREPDQPILAAPRFSLVSASGSELVEISGYGTPGRTVQAFVAEGSSELAQDYTDLSMMPTTTGSCPRAAEEDVVSVYSTGPLIRASWNLVLSGLDAGDYTVTVIECAVIEGSVISSVFSSPLAFTISP